MRRGRTDHGHAGAAGRRGQGDGVPAVRQPGGAHDDPAERRRGPVSGALYVRPAAARPRCPAAGEAHRVWRGAHRLGARIWRAGPGRGRVGLQPVGRAGGRALAPAPGDVAAGGWCHDGSLANGHLFECGPGAGADSARRPRPPHRPATPRRARCAFTRRLCAIFRRNRALPGGGSARRNIFAIIFSI